MNFNCSPPLPNFGIEYPTSEHPDDQVFLKFADESSSYFNEEELMKFELFKDLTKMNKNSLKGCKINFPDFESLEYFNIALRIVRIEKVNLSDMETGFNDPYLFERIRKIMNHLQSSLLNDTSLSYSRMESSMELIPPINALAILKMFEKDQVNQPKRKLPTAVRHAQRKIIQCYGFNSWKVANQCFDRILWLKARIKDECTSRDEIQMELEQTKCPLTSDVLQANLHEFQERIRRCETVLSKLTKMIPPVGHLPYSKHVFLRPKDGERFLKNTETLPLDAPKVLQKVRDEMLDKFGSYHRKLEKKLTKEGREIRKDLLAALPQLLLSYHLILNHKTLEFFHCDTEFCFKLGFTQSGPFDLESEIRMRCKTYNDNVPNLDKRLYNSNRMIHIPPRVFTEENH